MKVPTLVAVGLIAALAVVFAQTPVNQSAGPPPKALQTYLSYTGTYLTYLCYADSQQQRPLVPIAISAASNAAAVEFTSAAHGLNPYSKPKVTIAGGTGNWTAVNGTRTATITGANTFTVPVNSTSLGALTGTLTFTTTAPRLSDAVWAVEMFTYDGSNNLVTTSWVGGEVGFVNVCTTPTSYQ
jgi:hypothetical protein